MPAPRQDLVLVAEPLDPECLAWLAGHAQVTQARQGTPEFDDALARADALIVRTYARVDAHLLTRAPHLRVVGRAGVGLDNIDLPACAARGVRVVNTPDANTQAVVEFVFALMLDQCRPLKPITRALSLQEWESQRASVVAPRQLSELTLGILGLGRIGSRVARVARAIGMRVIFHDIRPIDPGDGPGQASGAEPVDQGTLLRQSDILTIHVDGRPSNARLIGAPELALLKPDARLINTSRGFVVDTQALATWLFAHPEARASLDVHDPEPFGPDHPLLGLPNASLHTHMASGTAMAKKNMSWVVRDLVDALHATAP